MQLLMHILPLTILFVQLAVVTCTVNTAENDIIVRQIQFNRSLRNGIFHSFVNKSFTDCVKACSGIQTCQSISYILEADFCELSHLDTSYDALETLSGSLFISKDNWKYDIPS